MSNRRCVILIVLLFTTGCSKYDPKLSPVMVQLNALKEKLDHWQRNRTKLQTLISELKRDKANALEQLDRLGAVSDEDIANNPKAKIYANELQDILRQLPVYEKRYKEYDLAILQNESKIRAIERRLSAEAAGVSDAELEELTRAMTATDESLATEMAKIPPALGERWQDELARYKEGKQPPPMAEASSSPSHVSGARNAPATSPSPSPRPDGKMEGRASASTPIAPPPLAVAPFSTAEAKEHQRRWGEYLNAPLETTNSIGMRFVLIPPGEFMMGNGESAEQVAKAFGGNAASYMSEYPQHRVRITRPFYLGQYPVTQEEYQRVMGTNPSHFSASGRGKDKLADLDTRQSPVECVSWDDAMEFCRRLGQQEGKTYRLPTEAEYEYACRAGTTTRYSSGDDENELGNYAWYFRNSESRTHRVGQKRPNPFGLYDMHGNVYQWCADWYGSGYYAASPTDDPKGPDSGSSRVCRGGCWANGCRSAGRREFTPGARGSILGFRVARVVE